MKKVFLGLFLLALLAGISYLKEFRQQGQTEKLIEAGKHEITQELTTARQSLDSLRFELAKQVNNTMDSLQIKESDYQCRIDSLIYVVDSLENKLAEVKQDSKVSKSLAKSKKSDTTKLTHKNAAQNDKILGYYKERYKALPTDLSQYERRVALAEIREETAQYFKISIAELNRIRKKNNLNY